MTMSAEAIEYDRGYEAGVRAERDRCLKIANAYVENTNAGIAHAIANAIRKGEE